MPRQKKLLDYNTERSIQTTPKKEDSSLMSSSSFINYDQDVVDEKIKCAKVHIDTLSAYDGFCEGSYFITDVKRMWSKEDFLDMPLKDRKCSTELYEDCRTRNLLEECNFSPLEVPGFEVRTFQKKITMTQN